MFPPENSIYWRHVGLHLRYRQFDIGDYTYCAANEGRPYVSLDYWRHSVVSHKLQRFEAVMPMAVRNLLTREKVELIIYSDFELNDVMRMKHLLALKSEYNLPVYDQTSFERLLVLEKLTEDENHD